ncbi:hypothetical protein [Tautonia plasticadhaerens]|uniref:Type II secretion system protein n=1 Tax=Tautonia plasticadhaerens TaxID=2527974 RepID=A0A518GWR9_9BACT|nr:hypothetical protein [Tautonia plasticadhaerens]QDV33037.1 hypothetical protein ElP_08790 [Tautonia plasticadhaerens]
MRRHRSDRRRGGAALVALVCLSLIAMVVAGLLRLGASRAAGLDAVARRAQADWLVEAGLERAALRVSRDPDYGGETWDLPAEALGGRAGSVVIEVERGEGGASGPRVVRVRADYPSDGDPSRRVRRTKVFQVRPIAGIGGGDS